jgi:hypothetical protein
MKTFYLFFFIAIGLCAETTEKKWIPIQPIDLSEKKKIDTNVSVPKSEHKLIQNVKIFQQLLDKSRGDLPTKVTKSWYSLDEMDND